MLFGPGNSFSYQSQGQGVDLNQEVSIIDNIQMGRLFQGEHQGVPVTYTVQTNGKESLTSLHYEGESRNRDIISLRFIMMAFVIAKNDFF